MNCWQLVKVFYSSVFKIALQSYIDGPVILDDDQKRIGIEKLIYSNRGDFILRNEAPEFGDLILLKIRGFETHIAVYIGEGKILHTLPGRNSCIEPLSRWSGLVTGFYCHKERAAS